MFVIAGSSGNTGSIVAETLLSRGEKVRLIVRDERKVEHLVKRGAELAKTHLEDSAGLAKAFRGARGAYLLLPPSQQADDLLRAQGEITAAFAEALRTSPVEHVVLLSSIGAHLPSGTGPIRSLHHAEQVLSKSASQLTFLRASYFMENFAGELGGLSQGVFPTFLRTDLSLPMVATADIGTTAAGALLEGGRGRSIIELEGPRRYTAAEVARELSHLVNKPITLQVVPESAIVSTLSGFGLPANTAALYHEMIQRLNAEEIVMEGGAARHVRGTTPISHVLTKLLRAAGQH